MPTEPPLGPERDLDPAPPEPPVAPWRKEALAYHGPRIALAIGLAALTYALFPASPAVDVPIYEAGSVAPDNVIAPIAFRVLKSDDELQRERDAMARAVEPIYTFVPAALDSARRLLGSFSASVEGALDASRDPRTLVPALQRVGADFEMTLSPAEAGYLANDRRREALVTTVGRVFDRWLGAGVASAGALDNVRGDVVLRTREGEERRISSDSILTFSMLVSRARLSHPDPESAAGDALFMRLLGNFFRPTVVPDRTATELRREEVRRAVSVARHEVQAGEKIIGANEVVGREEHDKLRALREALEGARGQEGGTRRVAGAVLFNFLLVSLLGVTIVLFRRQVYRNYRWLLMFTFVAAGVIIGAAVVSEVRPLRPELIPLAMAAVLLSALFDQRISMIAVMVLAVLVGGQAVFRGTNALYINLVGGAVAAFSVQTIQRRNQSYYWIAAIASAYVATAVAIGLALDQPAGEILSSAGFGLLNAVVSVLLALLILPMAEAFTGVETDLTLLEWSDLNRPLMQRLSLEAPGTYAHTIAIANLAEAATRAIGANALLARVGAYYHDIGKIAKPQYFVENQPKGRNPHDRLDPPTSARIIRNHVREGLELAEEHKLPKALRAFITEHHGTGSIAYFLEKAKERDGGKPDPVDYAYPGPIPQSAETAVVLLADGVEAATRVLSDPTPEKVRDVVDHIVRQRIEQRQLDDAPLTLRQIDIIKAEFARVLSGMYHNRIEYPTASGGITADFVASAETRAGTKAEADARQ